MLMKGIRTFKILNILQFKSNINFVSHSNFHSHAIKVPLKLRLLSEIRLNILLINRGLQHGTIIHSHKRPIPTPKLNEKYIYQSDVLLYENNDTRYFKMLNLFGLSQFIFWSYLGYISATTLKDKPVSEEEMAAVKETLVTDTPKFVPLMQQLNLGFLALVVSSLYTKRSIKSLILRKGGKTVTFEFFSPFGKGKCKTLTLNDVSARNSRHGAKTYIAFQLRKHKFFFILDTKGNFLNNDLFDRTVGMMRSFK